MIPTNTYKILESVWRSGKTSSLQTFPSNEYEFFSSIYDEENDALRINIPNLLNIITDIVDEEVIDRCCGIDNSGITNCNYVIKNFETTQLHYVDKINRCDRNKKMMFIYQIEYIYKDNTIYKNYIGNHFLDKRFLNNLRDFNNIDSILHYFNKYYNQDDRYLIQDITYDLKRIH